MVERPVERQEPSHRVNDEHKYKRMQRSQREKQNGQTGSSLSSLLTGPVDQ